MNQNGSKDVKPWDFIKPSTEYVATDLAETRYNVCKFCPELIKLTKQCKKCGCFMRLKTTLKDATCPMGKW